ncbi:hypothetical protein PsdCFBP2356_06385 [Pseudomonas syringae pv. dysoxyli]|nr:hypothetical protein [Pseudomonas syringae pv. dysoxyli]
MAPPDWPQFKAWRCLRNLGRFSFYAVILAYCRDFESADREMASIAPFRAGFTDAQRHEFDSQLSLIEDIRAGRVR